MFYHFSQNNSGGVYALTETLGHDLYVEASSPEQANERAESLGIYFGGVASRADCACCGDRWTPAESWTHTLANMPAAFHKPAWMYPEGRYAVAHFQDGSFRRVNYEEGR